MINNEILNFIKDRRSQGETKEQITDMLVTHGGWDTKDVEEAFDAIEMNNTSVSAVAESVEKSAGEAFSSVKKDEVKNPESEKASPLLQPKPEAEKINLLNIAPAPATEPKVTPPAPSVSGMQNASIFNMMAKPEPEKVLHPTMRVFSSTPEPIIPKEQKTVISPASDPVKPVSSPIAPMGGENALKDLRARFMEGRIVSLPSLDTESGSAKPSVSPPAGGISFPKITLGNPSLATGLSTHLQAGMTPSEVVPTPIDISTPSPKATDDKPLAVSTVASRPFAGFSPGQKVSVVSGNLAQQRSQSDQIIPAVKTSGRKLLGFFMFAIGLVFGAVVMHAYLNGYLDPAMLWITEMIKSAGL